jgi:hypothetical protein
MFLSELFSSRRSVMNGWIPGAAGVNHLRTFVNKRALVKAIPKLDRT